MTVPPFVHSPLGAFGLFSVWDNIIQNCYQHSSVGVCINISLISIDKHQEWYCWFIWEVYHWLCKKLPNSFPFCIPTSNVWEFHLLQSLTGTWYYQYFYLSHSSRYVVSSHWDFNLNFQRLKMMYIFLCMCLLWSF